ncbi:hypothetical protein [Legionella maioricensis]|uniref:Lytic transglycosylase MltA domain-containing protein n=1 Tax=Legionella maioricensis TaxID=2896528 RepID=A0A9X2D172_9GAMM|nr:hypothetical protein [Legionella maioricensis]MCL9684449.1 hypothetical protein [Legionella maioricensis]MCL9688848.1 hypothetical protein [Legionella maioricensis]
MRIGTFFSSLMFIQLTFAAPQFKVSTPDFQSHFDFKAAELCATAKETLAYLNKGSAYDPQVIHAGKAIKIPLERVKATLVFICQNQNQLNNPAFIKQHFDFVRWYPDLNRAKQLAANKPLLLHLPKDRILMTKYYVHLAKASSLPTPATPFALYALPKDEQHLTLEQANTQPHLTRFKYGKQSILKGALEHQAVPKLAYFSREDLEAALLQGTVVADFGGARGKKIFNVHRNNNIAYDRSKNPYTQERFWYFKQVAGIKGYGKDAEYKITVNPAVTFAADLEQLGLGKMLMIQYHDPSGAVVSKAGILADTGGAFADNLYQVDYLAGSYPGREAFSQATRHLPDYVDAYFMVLKESK